MTGKKKQVIETGRALFLKQGISSTTMEQIAEAVPVSKMTIYKYFESKEGLVESVIDALIEEGEREFQSVIDGAKSPVDALAQLANYSGMTDITDKFILDLLQNYPDKTVKIISFKKTIMSRFEQIIFDGQKAGQIRKEISPAVLGMYLQSMNVFFSNPALYEGIGNLKTVSNQIMQLLYHGILAPGNNNI